MTTPGTAEAVRSTSVRKVAREHQLMASAMYDQHHTAVFRYIRSRVGTQAEAEDLTSDVFYRAMAGIGNYRPVRSSALPWLYTIAAHRVVDHYRSARPTGELDEAAKVADSGPNPADVVVTKELVREVWTLSAELPASQRRALWLRYGEELELREIAALMGRSVEAVKLLVHRATRAIRTSLSVDSGRATLSLASANGGGLSHGRRAGKGGCRVRSSALAA